MISFQGEIKNENKKQNKLQSASQTLLPDFTFWFYRFLFFFFSQ